MDDASIRVLLILENAGSGSGRHVIDLARGLLARGHDVTLLYSLSRLEGWFERDLQETTGLRTATIDIRPGLGLGDIATILKVRRFVRSAGPFDIVHGHSSKGGALARIGALGLAGARVYTPHAFYTLGADPGSVTGRFYGLLERALARISHGIICVSSAEHAHALALGLPEERLFTVPNGLDVRITASRAATRERLGLGARDVCIGFVGRLARQKAVHRLLEAFAIAHQTQRASRLVVVGFGPDEDALKARASALGLDASVTWTGEASGVEMMSAFDIFALPSLYEAFPYVLLEAMTNRLPIVSMRVGGVDELIEEGINGHVIEQDDVELFGRRLAELASDATRRSAMGDASAATVAGFGTAQMVARTLDVYRDLTGSRDGARQD